MEIIWLPKAIKTFKSNLDYLEEFWPRNVSDEFIQKVERTIFDIRVHSKMYPLYDKKRNIHFAVIVPQIKLYYQVKPGQIDLLLFWDNRQNPEKLKL